ncbi:hypothetical protein [Nocardioides terrisoli]|uniref:hypothetical protein n=1 Tax=Nocardioides terrisoli TaxID=3388267 RepID=UPI00287B72FE|nr:hypothetical protein [Nocardioides marmorisolisilvae]
MRPISNARPRGWLLRVVAGLLAVVLVASIVIIVLMARDLRAQDRLDADRRDALSVAEQFALRMDNFAAPSADAYESGIEALLTTKGQADFAQVKPLIAQVYAGAQPQKGQQGKAATGSIALAGVTDLDSDSATVLVAHDSSVTGTGKALHFRWTVSLRKVEGSWLVDGLPPEVAGSQ